MYRRVISSHINGHRLCVHSADQSARLSTHCAPVGPDGALLVRRAYDRIYVYSYRNTY